MVVGVELRPFGQLRPPQTEERQPKAQVRLAGVAQKVLVRQKAEEKVTVSPFRLVQVAETQLGQMVLVSAGAAIITWLSGN